MLRFLRRSEELAARERAEEARSSARPARREDAAAWRHLPPVPGPFGGGWWLPRKSIRTTEEARDKVFDFFKQLQFGLWGYRQRPYPLEKPLDVQQALGFHWLERRYFDFTMRGGSWYYKDRLGRSRGPMELVQMKTAWAGGIIDKNTFVWGDDLDEWAPVGMVYGLERAIATPDVRFAAWGTELVHKLGSGKWPWAKVEGQGPTSYKRIQREALEKKEDDKAVLRANGGVWPGERIPSHVLGMWAGGSELTSLLEDNHRVSPNKFIPYNIRKRLAREIPGLRPWEVANVEQIFDLVTFRREWYREPLGDFSTVLDFEEDVADDTKQEWEEIQTTVLQTFSAQGKLTDR
eukprot:SM000050S17020  [mRNA]  locus=s50:395020:397039:- [translate_table: standard]